MLVSSSASAVQLLVLKGVPQGKKKTVAGTERGHQAAGHETDGGERAREDQQSEARSPGERIAWLERDCVCNGQISCKIRAQVACQVARARPPLNTLGSPPSYCTDVQAREGLHFPVVQRSTWHGMWRCMSADKPARLTLLEAKDGLRIR